MQEPQDTLVRDMVSTLNDNLREDFEERAAIVEFEGKVPRAHAECLALLDVLRRNPATRPQPRILKIEMEGTTTWLLSTDLAFARKHLAGIEGIAISILDEAEETDRTPIGYAI